ncbi:MAG: hypothetical protein IJI22_04445 [Bacilli bacterium]|nr:hypothetical protein [Bacilli bacterium]
MHNRKRSIQLYFAKILILFSFALFTYGFILDFKNSNNLVSSIIDPVKSDNTVSMTPVRGTEVVSEEKPNDTTKVEKNPANNPSDATTNEVPNNSNNGNVNNTNNGQIPSTNNGSSNSSSNFNVLPQQPTVEDANNNYRRQIENTYGVTIKYGSETNGYTVGGVGTTPITDPNQITNALNDLKYSLALYPSGLFAEIRNGGIPLTIILVNSYSDNTITGVTDSDYNSATISIATIYPFGESFYHESYHYIERYMFKRGANYNSWDFFNPAEFSYGSIRNDYSYANTFLESAPFVNNYAQTDAAEDRASTFEYMMASSKASCLNYGTTVWQKANLMAENMDAVLYTVRPDVKEYWERYLY